MKKNFLKLIILILTLSMLLCVPSSSFADNGDVFLGGIPAGFSLNTRGATVVGLSDISIGGDTLAPSKTAGVKVGDIILNISGYAVNTSADIEKALADKDEVELEILRGAEIIKINVTPSVDALGKKRLGLFIRNNVSGIGTVTYIKDGKFASLGHPVLSDNGNLLEILDGNLFACTITGAQKGAKGRAGELKGVFLKDEPFANAEANKNTGIYGSVNNENLQNLNLKKVSCGEAKVGNATIYTTVDGETPIEYDISIIKVDKHESGNRNLVIKITDENLIEITGGIVQGMSGSPILQNGKLVGAVTHVFINDPLRGFGINIDKMQID